MVGANTTQWKNRSMKIFSKSTVFRVCSFLCFIFPTNIQATSDNRQHELGVYSLTDYGEVEYEGGRVTWKSKIDVPPDYPHYYPEHDPANNFWDTMTGGLTSEYAHHTSKLRKNEQVNIRTIFSIPGDGWKDWDQFDLVFFFGHNNMITPPHPCEILEFWSNNSGAWIKITGDHCDWGKAALPYEYYHQDITGTDISPGSVVYLHEPFTSALLGWHFRPGTKSIVQTRGQDTLSGNSPLTTRGCRGGLGTNDMEWLILHGCQGVIVANQDGSTYNPMGVAAFSQTWDGFHIIMGHYAIRGSYFDLEDLDPFANDLLAGEPIQAAYFEVSPDRAAAISAERTSESLEGMMAHPEVFRDFLELFARMNLDTWLDPQADPGDTPNLWYVKWLQEDGTDRVEWQEPACGRLALAKQPVKAPGIPENFDLDFTTYRIKDKSVQRALGTDTVPIRAKSYQLPSRELPLLKLADMKEVQVRTNLGDMAKQLADTEDLPGPIKDLSHMVTTKVGSQIFWIAKASGTSSFSETKAPMAIPSTIRNVREAVALALNFVVQKELVKLGPHETIDVLFVSKVINAFVKDGQSQPVLRYPSDYFVGFGRRYRGIPVVGSRLCLRLGAEGKLFGVQKKWRPIIGEDRTVSIKNAAIMERVNTSLLARKILKPGQTAEKDLKILGVACGYFEGPISNEQQMMGPGCLVSYHPVKNASDADTPSQIVIPLDNFDFSLLGARKSFQPVETPPEGKKVILDADDRKADETN